MDNQLNYYNVKRQYALKFFQVPKVFMTSDKYKTLSAEAKLAFAVLSDRLQLSIKNHWFDPEGNIYFIYTGEQLEAILGCGHNKVNNVKRELKEAGLLVMQRMGQGRANRMYLLEPEITDADIYGIDQLETSNEETVNIDLPTSMQEQSTGSLDKSRFPKKGSLDFLKKDTSDTDLNNTDILKPLSTDSIKPDTLADSQKSLREQQDAALFENHIDNDNVFTKQQLLTLKLLSNNNFEQFVILQKTVFRAKKQALNKHKIQSSLFDFKDEDVAKPVHDVLMRTVEQVRLNAVKDVNSYVYCAMYDQFEQIGNKRSMANFKAGNAAITWS